MIYHEKTAKVSFKNKNKKDDLSGKDCKSLDSRTRTMISHLNIPTGCPTKGILNPPKRMPKYQGTHKNLNHFKRLNKKDHSGCLFILNANEVLY
jgi:hypothetical protein